jgi:hypothetical protein
MTTVTKMRLSKETYTILKNFASINSNIYIRPGNTLKTMSLGKNMFVQAKVAEDFDVDVLIWDLNQFLGIVSMFGNPDLEFHDKYVVISNGRSSVTYYYADESTLTYPTRDIKLPPVITTFNLDEQDLAEILKASNILQVNKLKIVCGDGVVKIVVDDDTKAIKNNFEIVISENYSGSDFSGVIDVSDIKFIPGSYTVHLTDSYISKFTHNALDLCYYLAINKD